MLRPCDILKYVSSNLGSLCAPFLLYKFVDLVPTKGLFVGLASPASASRITSIALLNIFPPVILHNVPGRMVSLLLMHVQTPAFWSDSLVTFSFGDQHKGCGVNIDSSRDDCLRLMSPNSTTPESTIPEKRKTASKATAN